jgi:hypothetical protein
MSNVSAPKPRGHQLFNILADDFVVGVTEQRGQLVVGEQDDAMRIDDDYCIGRSIERAAGEIRRGIE